MFRSGDSRFEWSFLMRLSLIPVTAVTAILLSACAPAADAPAADSHTHEEADDHGHDHSHDGAEDAAVADETIDRGVIAGSLALLEGSILVPPAGRDVTAGFGTFAAGERSITITAIQAPFAGAVEMHTHEMSDDGKMAMRKVENFSVPANGDHSLVRGGDHLMFFGVEPGSLEPGAALTATATIQFEDGTTEDVPVSLTVATPE